MDDLVLFFELREKNGRVSTVSVDRTAIAWLLYLAYTGNPIVRMPDRAWGDLLRECEWVFKPIDRRGVPHPLVEVRVRWQLFSEYSGAKVQVVVENCGYVDNKHDLFYDSMVIKFGEGNSEKTLAHLTNGTLFYQTRLGVEGWAGRAPPDLRIRPDAPTLDYLAEAGFIPPLRTQTPVTEAEAASYIADLMDSGGRRGGFDKNQVMGIPLNCGPVYRNMPTTGDREDLGPCPGWAYLLMNGSSLAGERVVAAGDMKWKRRLSKPSPQKRRVGIDL